MWRGGSWYAGETCGISEVWREGAEGVARGWRTKWKKEKKLEKDKAEDGSDAGRRKKRETRAV